MIDKIKNWDNNIIHNHIDNEVRLVMDYLKKKNKTKISFIDIGANVGKFYDLISKEFEIERCVMVEGSPILSNYLKDKFKDNDNISIFNFCLSDENGFGYINENFGGDNFGLSKISDDGTKIMIQSAKEFLDTIYLSNLIGETDFIKIDTENQDYQILDSIRPIIKNLNYKPLICFEHNYHNDMNRAKAKNIYESYIIECRYYGEKFEDLNGDCFLYPL